MPEGSFTDNLLAPWKGTRMRKKRIAFFQEDLGPGGIQKSLFNLLRNLDYGRVDAELFLFEEGCFYEGGLPQELTVHVLKRPPRICSFLPFETAEKLWHPDWEQYGEYDLAADFNSYQFSCAAGALGVKAKKRVMWIHNNVEIKQRNEWKYRVLWYFFKGKFSRFDGFVPCSPALEEPFRRLSGQTSAEYRVIANYIDVSEIRRKQREPLAEKLIAEIDENQVNFVALGRLSHQKGYDIMIPLFARCCRERDDLHLFIMGDGPERETLQQLIAQEAPGRIHLLGQQSNPYAIMNRMDAFFSTSRYEGQPLNIEEAKVIGLPIYCTRNLEQYTEEVQGMEESELESAILRAQKVPKQPDDLEEYNRRVLERIYQLAEL